MTAANKTNNLSTSQQSIRQLKQTCELKTRHQVVIAVGSHLFPFRTEKLSPLAPMVLQCNAGEQVAASFYLEPRGYNVPGAPFLYWSFSHVPSLCPLGSPISVNPYGELSFPFHPFTRERPPCPCCPLLPSASYPSRILMQKAWLLDADCNVT